MAEETASGQEANLRKTPPQSLRDDHHEVVHAAFSSSVPKRTKSIGPYLIHAERLLRAKKNQKNSRATLEDICELACETKYPGPATEQWELLGGSILPDISWPPMGTPSKCGASEDTDSSKQNSDSNSCGNNDITKDSEILNYCGGGIAATLNAFVLYQLGFQKLKVYDNSLSEWAMDKSLPMEID